MDHGHSREVEFRCHELDEREELSLMGEDRSLECIDIGIFECMLSIILEV